MLLNIQLYTSPSISYQTVIILFAVTFPTKCFATPAMWVEPSKIDTHLKEEESEFYWRESSENELKKRLGNGVGLNLGRAEGVIFFLGDGMSLSTVTGARVEQGRRRGDNRDAPLPFEYFPHLALCKTYCVDRQVADSACSATAFLSGVKARLGTLGVSGGVRKGDCYSVPNSAVPSLIHWAQEAGKSTGIVTTTRVTHATPAGAYAHVADRDWESDQEVKDSGLDPKKCEDIASQLVNKEPGKNINVIMGGGWKEFLPANYTNADGTKGKRLDGVNLIEKWINDRNGTSRYVATRDELLDVNTQTTDYLLGLFAPSHLEYHLGSDSGKEPTLADMTKVAIQILKKNPRGYFLLIEGGRIDHAHHDNMARRAFDETLEMGAAVNVALGLTDERETLILVTADHSHTMTLSGYPTRGGASLYGAGGNSDIDKIPYPVISYANGPGYYPPIKAPNGDFIRHNILKDDTDDPNYMFPANLPLEWETHGGEDVPLYSQGPWSHLFSGVMEQSSIPRIIQFATCIGSPGSISACNFTSLMNVYKYLTLG